jgi:alkanesulfonate monooxygenase SsuD/methylene tetrahydromethanopterin reductase-like flavin-dependent oxidoreductase (luciferase family)
MAPTLGILHDFRRPPDNPGGYGAYYAECVAEVEEADRLGLAAVWLSEHHLTTDGFLPSPLAMLAALAVRTRRIELGTNVLLLPLHHPLRVAEDAAVVDLLSGGRLVLGVGQGYAPHEFAAFGVDLRSRPARLGEGVEIIRRAWERGETGFAGRAWQIPEGVFGPRPERRIPIVFGAVAERAVDRAVRMADGLIVYCGARADLLPRAELLSRTLERRERAREDFRFVATGIMHVDEDAERAWAEAAPGIAYLEGELTRHGGADTPLLRREDYLVGTPEEVAAGLIELHRATGFDQYAAWARLPGLSHERALSSLRLLAERVIPRVRSA